MKHNAELPKIKMWNKIKTYIILIAAAISLGCIAWYFNQHMPWFGKKASPSLPISRPMNGSWHAFYADQGILKEEKFEDWTQRIQRNNPNYWRFWLTQLQSLRSETAYPLLKSPPVDSLIKDVSSMWDSDHPEIKSAKNSLFEVLARYHSLQKITESFIQDHSNQPANPGSPSKNSESTKPLEIIGMVGLFQYQTALTSSTLWLGLDMFMNEGYRYYPSVDHLYQYQRRRTAPSYLPVAVARTLAEDWVNENITNPSENGNTLIDQIIREGKTLACMRWLLPEIHDTLLLGYSASQWNWIKSNQVEVWRDLVSQDLLFSGDPSTLSRYLSDGPFSSGYPEQSPPALGLFIGDAVIQKWILSDRESQRNPPWIIMLENRNLPSSQILKKSGYKGR